MSAKKQEPRFATVRRGLDPAEVDEFLATIAANLEAAEAALREGQATPEVASASDGTPAVVAPEPERIARLGAVGEREVAQMLAEARSEAATIAAEAASEADRIRRSAESEAARTVEEARAFLTQVEADARETLSNVVKRRRELIAEFQRMQARLLSIAQELELTLNPAGPEGERPDHDGVETEAGL